MRIGLVQELELALLACYLSVLCRAPGLSQLSALLEVFRRPLFQQLRGHAQSLSFNGPSK